MSMVLGVWGLPAAEVSLIKSIVRLSAMLGTNWTVADGTACDLLLTDGPIGTELPVAGTTVIPVARQDDMRQQRTLLRPIRAEALVALLNEESARRAAPVLAQPAHGGVAAEPAGVNLEQGAARLRRWPSWEQLKGDRTRLRMASMLSSASLQVDRLSELTGVRRDVCLAFLRDLDAHRLLTWTAAPAQRSAPRVSTAAPVASRQSHPVRQRGIALGLLHSLRRKLGIAGAA